MEEELVSKHRNTLWFLFALVIIAAVANLLIFKAQSSIEKAQDDATLSSASYINLSPPPGVVEVPDEEESVIIKPPGPVEDEKLSQILKSWAESNLGDYSFMVREISGDQRTASYNIDGLEIPGSTYKIFLLFTAFTQIEKGELSFDTTLINGMTITQCIDSLLVYSQDICSFPVGKAVGWNLVDPIIQGAGFRDTRINNYTVTGAHNGDKQTSVVDLAEFMWRLHGGYLLPKKYNDIYLSKLKIQHYRERIPAGVPSGIVVADKPGFVYAYQNDTAIVWGKNSTYVFSMISNGSTLGIIPEISRIVYEYLN